MRVERWQMTTPYASLNATKHNHLDGDSEVDEVDFDADFWQVVGVGQLGGHVEPELGVIVHVTVSQPDQCARACGAQPTTC